MIPRAVTCPVVHVELRTANLARACSFLQHVFDWEVEQIHTEAGTYVMLELNRALEGGVVESDQRVPAWIPYVEVADIGAATERALAAQATLITGPREGPVGWRSVISTPDCGELAMWQPKR